MNFILEYSWKIKMSDNELEDRAHKIFSIITKSGYYPYDVKVSCIENQTVDGLVHFAMSHVIIIFNIFVLS